MGKMAYEEVIRREIIQLHLEKNKTIKSLSDDYGVSPSTISRWIIAFRNKSKNGQIEIKSGRLNPDKKEIQEGVWLPTPWNEIEVGMGVMANLPILLVRDDKIEIGVFDKVISEYQIKSLSSATPLPGALRIATLPAR